MSLVFKGHSGFYGLHGGGDKAGVACNASVFCHPRDVPADIGARAEGFKKRQVAEVSVTQAAISRDGGFGQHPCPVHTAAVECNGRQIKQVVSKTAIIKINWLKLPRVEQDVIRDQIRMDQSDGGVVQVAKGDARIVAEMLK